MKKIVRLNEEELTSLIKKVVLEQDKIDEGIFNPVTHAWRNLKGIFRGWGASTFKELSKLERLMANLTKLDNQKKMTEQLTSIRSKINSSGLPPDRISYILELIDKSLNVFKIHKEVVNELDRIKLDSWRNIEPEPKKKSNKDSKNNEIPELTV
jgi:hypothetical protein